MGQSPPGDTVSSGHGVALLNGPTEFGTHHPTPVQFTTDARKRAQPGDLLFCVRGSTTGRMNWADQEYAIGRGVAAIRHRDDPSLHPLVRGVIESELPELLNQATGSTFPNVSARQLAEIPYPSLSRIEQRDIAHVLGTLDDKIELNRRTNKTLEEMARVLFKSWFADFDPVRAKMEGRWQRDESLPGLPADLYDLFPERLVPSQLGFIPEGWEIKTLGELFIGKNARLGDEDVPEYSCTNFGLVPRSERFKKKLSASNSKNRVIRKGDFVFGLSRRILNFGLMRDDVGCVSPAYQTYSADTCAVIPDLLERIMRLRSEYFYLAVSASSREGQSVSQEALYGLKISLPNIAIQQYLYGTVQKSFLRSNHLSLETTRLVTLRDTLLPRLVSGEARVRHLDRLSTGETS